MHDTDSLLSPFSLADHQRRVLRSAFKEALAQGRVRPLLAPWCAVPFLVFPLVYLAIPHGRSRATRGRRLMRSLRRPLAAAIVAFNANQMHLLPRWLPGASEVPTSSRNLACAYGTGLIAVWGTLWALVLLVWTDPQETALRVYRKHGRAGEREGRERKKAPDATVADSLGQGMEYGWQGYPAASSFFQRLDWSYDLCTSWRGAGWNWSISQIPRFERPTSSHVRLDSIPQTTWAGYRRETTTARLVRARLSTIAGGYLLLDVVAVLMTMDPYFVLGPPPDRWRPWHEQPAAWPDYSPQLLALPPWLARLYRWSPVATQAYHNSLGFLGLLAGLAMFLSLFQLFFFALTRLRAGTATATSSRYDLWQHATVFGSFRLVFDKGMAGFWGHFWHQTFRVGFVAPVAWLVRSGLLSPAHAALPGLCVAFLLSGLLHGAGSYTSAGRDRTVWWHETLFFLLAGVGVAVQEAGKKLWRQLSTSTTSKTSTSWCRLGNFVYTLVWMLAISALFVDDLARAGVWLFEPVPFSPVRWLLCPSESAWRWYADDLPYWYSGPNWWSSGLAI